MTRYAPAARGPRTFASLSHTGERAMLQRADHSHRCNLSALIVRIALTTLTFVLACSDSGQTQSTSGGSPTATGTSAGTGTGQTGSTGSGTTMSAGTGSNTTGSSGSVTGSGGSTGAGG